LSGTAVSLVGGNPGVPMSHRLVLDLLRSRNTTLGVLSFILLNKSERTFVGLILKLIGKSQISPKDYVLVW
jgi:hypothetical protein